MATRSKSSVPARRAEHSTGAPCKQRKEHHSQDRAAAAYGVTVFMCIDTSLGPVQAAEPAPSPSHQTLKEHLVPYSTASAATTAAGTPWQRY